MMGLPRTGSTILHDLLAQDPDNRVPMTWECNYMSPPPEAATYDTDPRIADCEAHLERTAQALIPEFQAIHEMGALLAQECLMLNAFDFKSQIFSNQFWVPTYQRWVESVDNLSVYRTHKRQLQYMQWKNPRSRWVLKSTGYFWGLDAILEVYPDARIVMTHRDPIKLIASHCSLICMACSMGSDTVDRSRLASSGASPGKTPCASSSNSARAARPRGVRHAFLELVKDQGGHGRSGSTLISSCPCRPAPNSGCATSSPAIPKERHGTHRYKLEQFGLDPAQERKRYRFYQEYFHVADEA
ncbi:MAG: sulfotransferase [Gammaproteobacteria bacterium]|nr:sulfotransferase [Gammaproteobacteria bacterium]